MNRSTSHTEGRYSRVMSGVNRVTVPVRVALFEVRVARVWGAWAGAGAEGWVLLPPLLVLLDRYHAGWGPGIPGLRLSHDFRSRV